jgi:hypothetical protein
LGLPRRANFTIITRRTEAGNGPFSVGFQMNDDNKQKEVTQVVNEELKLKDPTKVERLDSGYKLETIQVQRKSLLKVIRGAGVGRTVQLSASRMVAGRVEEADLLLDDPAASRTHFEVISLPSGYLLRDLESTNGTAVNRVEVSECRLSNGDIITVGETDIGFFEETIISEPKID